MDGTVKVNSSIKHPVAVVVAALLACAGCRSERPSTVPVSGRVTFDGDAPPTAGRLYFRIDPPPPGFPPRPTVATFDRWGHFHVATPEGRNGLAPGRYTITVECWETPPKKDGPPSRSYVPHHYQCPTCTDLVVDIGPDERSRFLELDVVRH